MHLTFSKYQGAGNDFIIIDDRNGQFPVSAKLISRLCDRHFGIGADGLMLLSSPTSGDFLMRYFNSDGHESTMCGNGGRCIALFANRLGLVKSATVFWGIDGEHRAELIGQSVVRLKMKDVDRLEIIDDNYFIDTGSPHYVRFVCDVNAVDVSQEGKLIRRSVNMKHGGTNVNFVEAAGSDTIKIRTFERGVEAETLACGTGAVAASIAYAHYFEADKGRVILIAPGGELTVTFTREGSTRFGNIWLEGPAAHVFDGTISI